MSRSSQLSLEERCAIARLREAGHSIRKIPAALDRQPSTIARQFGLNAFFCAPRAPWQKGGIENAIG